jgi:hypothetical protein
MQKGPIPPCYYIPGIKKGYIGNNGESMVFASVRSVKCSPV